MSPPNRLHFFQRTFPSANMVLIKGKRPILFDTGDEFDTGDVVLRVIHTPSHTFGHISLYAAEEPLLICGDVIHRNDVAWLNPFAYGPNVIDQMLETVERLAKLPVSAFSHNALMLYDGLYAEELPAYLLRCAWFQDYSRHLFELEPADFVEPLLGEMIRSGAAAWQKGRLIARAPHHTPAEWLGTVIK